MILAQERLMHVCWDVRQWNNAQISERNSQIKASDQSAKSDSLIESEVVEFVLVDAPV